MELKVYRKQSITTYNEYNLSQHIHRIIMLYMLCALLPTIHIPSTSKTRVNVINSTPVSMGGYSTFSLSLFHWGSIYFSGLGSLCLFASMS